MHLWTYHSSLQNEWKGNNFSIRVCIGKLSSVNYRQASSSSSFRICCSQSPITFGKVPGDRTIIKKVPLLTWHINDSPATVFSHITNFHSSTSVAVYPTSWEQCWHVCWWQVVVAILAVDGDVTISNTVIVTLLYAQIITRSIHHYYWCSYSYTMC